MNRSCFTSRLANGIRMCLAMTLAFSVVMTLPPQMARADTLTVNITADENDGSCSDGDCSLRDAIQVAASSDTINFSLSYPAVITLSSGHLVIDNNLTITGPGSGQLTISGNDTSRVIWISGGTVTLSNLTISDGYAKGGNGGNGGPRAGAGGAGLGGALFVNTGVVTLSNIIFQDNQAIGGNGGGTNATGHAGGGGGGMWGNGGNGSTDGSDPGTCGGGGGGGGLTGNGGDGAGGFSATNGGAAGAGGGGRGGDNDGYNPESGDPGSDYGGGGGAGNAIDSYGRGGGNGGFGGGGGGSNNSSGTTGGTSTGGTGGFGGGGGGGTYAVGSAGAFGGNGCDGGPGGGGGGLGGAVFVRQGTLNLVNAGFFNNTADRGYAQGGCSNHGQGKGGAIFINAGATVNDDGNTIAGGNSADDAGATSTDNAHVYTVGATGSITIVSPEMDVLGNGRSIADGDSSPSSSDGTDFGQVAAGEQITHTFVISTSGPGSLHLGGSPRVALGGPTSGAFSVTKQPDSPIAAGTTTTFTIRFAPSSVGEMTATVSIVNNDADESPYDFVVKGATKGNTITVTTTADETNTNGQCSLREAILNSNHNNQSGSADCAAGGGPYDTLIFAPALANLTTTLGSELVITESVIIDASSVDGVTISGGSSVRAFHVSDGDATIRSLTIANGFVQDADGSVYGGGGIYAEGSNTSVHLERVTLRGCQADGIPANYTGYGGGLLTNNAAAYVVNSTFSGNGAELSGGAIADYQGSSIEIAHSTLTNNHGDHTGTGAGGIYLYDGRASLENSILAGNTGGQNANYYNELDGTLTSLGYNLSDTNPGDALTQTGDLPNKNLSTEIRLDVLQDNGGETWTHALLSGSVAIDAGKDAACPATDQRGVTRPQGSHCDIGAYEVEVAEPNVSLSKSVAPDTNVAYHGVVTYTLVLANSGVLSDTDVSLTDTLPAQVDFGGWIENHGAAVAADEITWSGVVTAFESITFIFTATHTGGYGETVANTAEFSGTVQQGSDGAAFGVEPNYAPVLGAIGNRGIAELATLTFTATATDANVNDSLTFTLDAGSVGSIGATSGAYSWTPGEADGPGVYTATVRVSDGALSDSETISVTVSEINHYAPILASIGDRTVNELDALTFTASATDSDLPTPPLTFTLDAGSVGSIGATSGAYSWTPGEADGPGVYTTTVRVSDGEMEDYETITITVAEVNHYAPILAGTGERTVNELDALTFTASATDSDLPTPPLTFTLDAGSVGSIGATSGAYSWTPGEADGPGAYTATIRVSDGELEDHETITITVAEVNQPPLLAPIGNKIVMSGTLLSFTATASDVDIPSNTLTFTLDAGAPAGASIDPASGGFTWAPTMTGEYPITIRVTDDGSPALDDAETITVTVAITVPNIAPVLNPVGDKHVDELVTLVFTAIATDANSDPLTFTLDAGSAGSITPAGTFTWTPGEADGPGAYTATVRVSDGELEDYETITITVSEVNAAPEFTSAPPTVAAQDIPYTYTVRAADVDLPANVLTITAPVKPAWLTLTPAGNGTAALAGTPSSAELGAHPVTLQVSDAGGLVDTQSFTITVVPTVCVQITDVRLDLLTSGDIYTDTPILLGVTITPGNLTLPYTYTINSGAALSGVQNPFTVTLSFDIVGTHTVEVAVLNCAMTSPITETLEVFVRQPPLYKYRVFLPTLLKNQ